jgi:pimeloyl-ACP methyl ester carboxylesterase
MRIGPIAAAIAAVIVVLAMLAGIVYEQAGRYRAARDFPPPGRMIDFGGRRLQLDCRGAGSPTVVFEAGQNIDGALSWSPVQPGISMHTRTCAYSRAGLMWSDASGATPSAAPSARQVAQDLHEALARAGEHGPYVLVGQSIGGLFATTFTHYFGAEVAGLVLVDPSHPEQAARVASYMTEKRSVRARIAIHLGWSGLLRAAAPLLVPQAPNQTAHDVQAIRAFAPVSMRTLLAEGDATDAVLAEAGAFRDLGDRPLLVLTAMAPYTAAELRDMKITPAQGREVLVLWKRMHDDMATWSSRGHHQLVPDSGHDIQFEQPEVVSAAVLSVVGAVRAGAGSDLPRSP